MKIILLIILFALSACGVHAPNPDDNLLLTMGLDFDADQRVNILDNCPYLYNPDQADMDYDGVGNACDLSADWDKLYSRAVGAMSLLSTDSQ